MHVRPTVCDMFFVKKIYSTIKNIKKHIFKENTCMIYSLFFLFQHSFILCKLCSNISDKSAKDKWQKKNK